MTDPKSKREVDDPEYAGEFGCEYLRTWQEGEYKLILWNTCRTDRYHKSILAYEFYHDGKLIFSGADFFCSPCVAVDSDQCVGSLLTFLSLRPGDMDDEYFEDYTTEQMDFAQSHGEELMSYAIELEEGGREH